MQITWLSDNRGWLDYYAALSLTRIDAALGRPLDINEAGRTWDQQNKFYQDYINGVPGASFALKPGTSIHEQGNAVDTDDRYISLMNDHGWFQTALARDEPWHFEYDWTRDNHRNDPAPSAGDAVDFVTPTKSKEDEMYAIKQDGVADSGIIIRGSDAPYTLSDGQFNLIRLTFDLPYFSLAKWQYDGIVNSQWIAFNTNKKLTEQGVDQDDLAAFTAELEKRYPVATQPPKA